MNCSDIFLDIRDEQELLDRHLVSNDPSFCVLNIPSRNVFANVSFLTGIAKKGVKIHLVCRSGNRTNVVKNTYFSDVPNIVSVDGGINKVSHPGVSVVEDGPGGMGQQQYIQLMFACILIVLLGLSMYMSVDYFRVVIVALISFILYQVYSKSCLVGSRIPIQKYTL